MSGVPRRLLACRVVDEHLLTVLALVSLLAPGLPSPRQLVNPPSTPGTMRFLMRTLAKVPRVMTRSLPRREP